MPIPERWEDYKPIGDKVKGTNFIAFKVPLRKSLSSIVDRRIRLDKDILLKNIPNLGLIIDLTNTSRYYDPQDFLEDGIAYEKLMVPGQLTPDVKLVQKFIDIVDNFIISSKGNGKLVGVHCTHGVNRTGFLICNYMISQMAISPNEAMDRFADARGHKIERVNYINALLNLREATSVHISTDEKKNYRENDRDREACNDRSHNSERRYYNSYKSYERSRSRSDDKYYSSRETRNRNYSKDRSSYKYERSYKRIKMSPSDERNQRSYRDHLSPPKKDIYVPPALRLDHSTQSRR